MKRIKYLACLIFSSILSLTSCLGNGDETIVLEKGELENLLYTNWQVKSCELFDAETDAYHSDLLNDPRLNSIYVFDKDGLNFMVDPEGNVSDITLAVDEDDHSISINNEGFSIASLGKGLMLLERHARINDELLKQRYYLYNLGEIDNIYEIETPDDGEDATIVVTSATHGSFVRNGYGFTIPVGAVPKGDNGQAGTVAFSAQNVEVNSLPGSRPDNVTFVEGSAIFANPSNFTFSTPIIIDVPLRGHSVNNTNLYHWNGLLGKWEIVPYSALKSSSKIQVSVIELGYFVLGTTTTPRMGGIKVNRSGLSSDYFYYLTLRAKGNNGSTSIAFSATGGDLYMANVALGQYEATITRERRSQFSSGATTIETASRKIDVTVSNTLEARGTSFADFTGWTIINLSAIEWNNGRPEFWGTETVTYGTGVFQATLNWVNYTGSTVDYDLHLTTPNGTEVFYGNRRGDGFELDRDITHAVGNCTENIYSISETLPKGTYKVRVHHYSGVTGRQYNCRVILNGRVVTNYSGITNEGYQDIYVFTLQ